MKRSDITKQKLLAAAENAFAEKGIYGARVDEISAAAGVNKRMLYAYFGSKEQLYVAVLETVYARMAEGEEELFNQQLDSIMMVKKIIEHFFVFLYENPNFTKMVLWENLNEAQYLKESGAMATKGVSIDLLRKVLREGVEQGVFRQDIDVEEMVLSINMFCFSYFSNIHTMAYIMNKNFSGRAEIEKRCAHITDIILRYIVCEEA